MALSNATMVPTGSIVVVVATTVARVVTAGCSGCCDRGAGGSGGPLFVAAAVSATATVVCDGRMLGRLWGLKRYQRMRLRLRGIQRWLWGWLLWALDQFSLGGISPVLFNS